MTAPETIARYALITALETEFGADGFPVRDDHLHPEQGHKGTVLGVSPDNTSPDPRNGLVGSMQIKVQFYGKWKKDIDPEQKVSPAWVEAQAERFRNVVRTQIDPSPGGGALWYFTLTRLEYVSDPTGNKTRFEAYLTARGNNTALLETTS